MNDDNNDNFQYLLQLTKLLTSECRTTRQETDKIDLLLKRVAKQSAISYEKLGESVSDESMEKYENMTKSGPINELINENYDLLYQIEQQKYINNKIVTLIRSITEHLTSIKIFVTEQKLTREQDIENFTYECFESKTVILRSSIKNLEKKKEISAENINNVVNTLKDTLKEINWKLIDNNLNDYKILNEKINYIENLYSIKLLE